LPRYRIDDRGEEADNNVELAVTFLIIAIIAAALGFSGIAGTAVNIAWILFVVGLILAIVLFVAGRRPPI
jgi:uncharacterized membrane protein YtjA (UPF0391 family)